ncbi:MAG: succinylglutamate desuccinylase/aspartoacylase family protein [Anaerolineae bacterium]
MAKTQVVTDIDYDRPGKQQGSLRVPYSHNEAGWANLLIPITVVNGGPGRTLLAMGGNHGDEFEGPVALMKLARSLQPQDVQGRVIIIPGLNLPALRAGTRLSPIDGRNLNRSFPGQFNDTVTGLIAHYVSSVLFPLADAVMDLHSGGRSMDFVPCAHLHRVPDEDQFQRMLAAARAFGSPYVFIYADIAGEAGLLPGEAERQGKLVITTEMGGAGQCSPAVLRIAERGVRNELIHLGMLEGTVDAPPDVPIVSSTEREDYHLSPADGLYESFLELGDEARVGQPLGQVHFSERWDRTPEVVRAATEGVLISRRFPCVTRQGDCVATVARRVHL